MQSTFFGVELFATDCSPVWRRIPNWASGEAKSFLLPRNKIKQSDRIVSSLFLQTERHAAHSSPSHFAAWRQTPSICFLIFSCTQLSITAGKFHMFTHIFPFSKHTKSFTKSHRPCVDLFVLRNVNVDVLPLLSFNTFLFLLWIPVWELACRTKGISYSVVL